MKGKPIPEQTIRLLIKKAESSRRSYASLAKEMGISPSVISRYRYLQGLIVRKHRKLTEDQIKEIRHRYIENGESGPDISKSMNIPHSYIYEIIGKGNKSIRSVHSRLEASLKWEGKRIGSDNPNYRHGRSKCNHKSSFFLDAWKDQVKKRDGYKCLACGAVDELECHHIIPEHDERYEDNPLLLVTVDNGITLCSKCHQPTAHREKEFEDECRSYLKNAAKRGNS
jgi:predicted DNA-binding protein YlxM (UPF0122 family)